MSWYTDFTIQTIIFLWILFNGNTTVLFGTASNLLCNQVFAGSGQHWIIKFFFAIFRNDSIFKRSDSNKLETSNN